MGNIREPFELDTVYHVYNHGNAEDIIFREDKNYEFFLKKYRKYISSMGDTYAYCLMPNHFHFMVGIKGRNELKESYKEKYPKRNLQSFQNFADLISNTFKNFLISYVKSFNYMYNRRGSLLLDNLKPITDEDYFTRLICYIHLNPMKHGFADKITDWPHSFYWADIPKIHSPKTDRGAGVVWRERSFIKVHQNNRWH